MCCRRVWSGGLTSENLDASPRRKRQATGTALELVQTRFRLALPIPIASPSYPTSPRILSYGMESLPDKPILFIEICSHAGDKSSCLLNFCAASSLNLFISDLSYLEMPPRILPVLNTDTSKKRYRRGLQRLRLKECITLSVSPSDIRISSQQAVVLRILRSQSAREVSSYHCNLWTR